MTTAAIAVGTPLRWRGVLRSYDGGPTSLGPELWRELQARLQMGWTVEDFCSNLLQFDSWEGFMHGGMCRWCGRLVSGTTVDAHGPGRVLLLRDISRPGKIDTMTEGQRSAIRDGLTWVSPSDMWGRLTCSDTEKWMLIDAEFEMRINEAHRGRPDPECKFHSHPAPPPDDRQITEANRPAPDWVYIVQAGGTVNFSEPMLFIGRPGYPDWMYGLCITTWADEPNWDEVAERVASLAPDSGSPAE